METGPRVGSVLSRKRLKSATVPLGGNALKRELKIDTTTSKTKAAFGGIHLTGPVERRSSPGAIRWRAFQARRVPAHLRRRGSHGPGPPGGD